MKTFTVYAVHEELGWSQWRYKVEADSAEDAIDLARQGKATRTERGHSDSFIQQSGWSTDSFEDAADQMER